MTSPSQSWLSPLRLFGLIAATIGLGARLRSYVAARSLWYDELLLASNLVERSWLELARPLHFNQSAPILFLWIERAFVSLAGPGELALRAFPLLCGLALPAAVWLVGTRVLGARDAAFAGILTLLSTPLIYYSNEVKQYGVDALVTVVLAGLTVYLIEDPVSRGRWWLLAVASTGLLWLSQPAAFIATGVAGALVLSSRIRATAGWQVRTGAIVLAWALTFGGLYLAVYQAAAQNPNLLKDWSSGFLDIHAPDFVDRAYRHVSAALVSSVPLGLDAVPLWLVILAYVAGVIRVARVHSLSIAVLLVLPQVALAGASVLGKYPSATRFLLCTVPLTFLVYAAFLGWIVDLVPPAARRVAVAMVGGIVLLLGAGPALDIVIDPPPREETRPLVRELERHPGDAVYVAAGARYAWAFYTEHLPGSYPRAVDPLAVWPDQVVGNFADTRWDPRLGWLKTAPRAGWAADQVASMDSIAKPAVWVLATHMNQVVIDSLLATAREKGARVVYAHPEPGAVLYRLRFAR